MKRWITRDRTGNTVEVWDQANPPKCVRGIYPYGAHDYCPESFNLGQFNFAFGWVPEPGECVQVDMPRKPGVVAVTVAEMMAEAAVRG